MRGRSYTSLEAQFWQYTDRRGHNECWAWTGSKNRAGYGQLTHHKQHHAAHRVAHELFIGPITERNVNHACDNRWCVNPAHLRQGSQSENMKDCVAKGRMSDLIYGLMEQRADKPKRIVNQALSEAARRKRRDVYGRFNSTDDLPPRQRDARGHFITKERKKPNK